MIMNATKILHDTLLDYTKIDKRFHLIPRELDVTNKSYIYGEVDPTVILSVLLKENILQEGDSFLDIGSGCGKMIISLANNPCFPHNNFTGIEIHQTRYNASVSLLDSYELYDKVEFILGDYNTLYFRNYNVLYCCNTIFGEKENEELFDKILREFSGYFILFEYNSKLAPYLIGSYIVKTSWNNRVDIWLFNI
jgi:ubiquinone/menaquinone biosynthesis C-methylase UbiE